MTNPLSNTTPREHTTPSVKDSVFQQIESEKICPRSRLFFQGRECVVWTLWLASIIIGALALAVIFYVGLYMHYAPYEATHQNWVTFIISALPYAWLTVFLAMAYLAATEFRRTKRGYRYRTVQVIGSSVLLSVMGGLALHGAGLGYAVDNVLGKQMGTYTSMEKAELKRWQEPAAGRLLGQLQPVTALAATTTDIVFIDRASTAWLLEVTELTREEVELLRSNQMVRLLGMDEGGNVFYTCAVLPWHYSRRLTHDDFVAARIRFTERMLAHKYNNQTRQDSFDTDSNGNVIIMRCPDMPAVQKI